MIRIDSEFSSYFNEVIHSFAAALYYEGVDDKGRLEAAIGFFPKHLQREKPETCLRVMDDLYYWTKDNYMHDLDNLHQLGLYEFLYFVQDYEVDIGSDEFSQIFYSSEKYDEMVNDIWKSANIVEIFDERISKKQLISYLQDISTIIGTCFDDIDFITFPELLAPNRDDGSDPHAVIQLVDDYVDILPQDITASYRKRFEKHLAHGDSLFQIVGKLLESLAHMAKYDTLGTALSSGREKDIQYILNPLFKVSLINHPDIHMSYEPSLAKASPDFVFQRGPEIVIVEIKLGSVNIKHGIERQLTHYMKALQAKESYMLIICQSDKQLSRTESLLSSIQIQPDLNICPLIFNASSDKYTASKL